MADKNIVEVVIDGKIYQLMGTESEADMHEVASELNEKILDFKKQVPNYNKLDDNLKALLLEINICDDLFKEQRRTRKSQQDLDDQERDLYSAKHDLVNMQMKLETALKELENTQKKLADQEAKEAARLAREKAMMEQREKDEDEAATKKLMEEKVLTTDKAQESKTAKALQKILND